MRGRCERKRRHKRARTAEEKWQMRIPHSEVYVVQPSITPHTFPLALKRQTQEILSWSHDFSSSASFSNPCEQVDEW